MESGRLSETLLVFRAQVGDDDAFEELFRHFSARTHRYLDQLLGYPAADDAQQEVWVSVYRRISSLSDPQGFRSWLFQITRNRAIDVMRRGQRERAILADEQWPTRIDEMAGESVSDADLRVDDERISAGMAKLSPEHREVLLLRFWEDLSYPEIALLVGAPVGTVRSRLHHAKRLLREQLADVCPKRPINQTREGDQR